MAHLVRVAGLVTALTLAGATGASAAKPAGVLRKVGRWVAPVRIARDGAGFRLETVGKLGHDDDVVIKTERQADGARVVRERQLLIDHAVEYDTELESVTKPGGRVTQTRRYLDGKRPDEVFEYQDKYRALTLPRAIGKAVWASPVVKAATIAGVSAVASHWYIDHALFRGPVTVRDELGSKAVSAFTGVVWSLPSLIDRAKAAVINLDRVWW